MMRKEKNGNYFGNSVNSQSAKLCTSCCVDPCNLKRATQLLSESRIGLMESWLGFASCLAQLLCVSCRLTELVTR